MFIKLKEDYGGHKKGSVIEELDAIGRAYVDAGKADESNASEQLRSSVQSEVGDLRSEVRSVLEAIKGNFTAPPPGGNGAEVRNGEAAADRGTKCFGDILRCIWMEAHPHLSMDDRQFAHTRLNKSYQLVRGSMASETSRSVDSLGVERVGTESLSGGATYGYLVKPEYLGTLFKIAIEESCIAPDAFNVPLGNALEMQWPAMDQYQTPVAGQSAAYAGVALYRVGETTPRIESDGKLSTIDFKTTDLTGFTSLSRDLLADNYIAADGVIQELFGMAFAWKTDYEYLNGTGVGAPLGIRNAGNGSLLTQTRNTAAKVLYEDLSGMQQKLHPTCWRDAFWLANITTLSFLQSVTNTSGTLMYQPNSLISQAMTPETRGTVQVMGNKYRAAGQLMGFPLIWTEKLPVLGQIGDIMLVHPKSYGIATRQGLEVGMSDQFYFSTDKIAYRFKLRNDAKPLWKSYYTQSDGGTTGATKTSPFITLGSA